jgi:hypothetical protein
MKKKLFFLFFLFLSVPKLFAQTYLDYFNSTYGFQISYPQTLIPQGESYSKDGQKFVSADKKASLSAYMDRSANLIVDETDTYLTFEQYYKREIKPDNANRKVTYKKFSPTFFVISGTENNRIFYRKTINTSNGWFTFELVYDESEKDFYNKTCGVIGASFK